MSVRNKAVDDEDNTINPDTLSRRSQARSSSRAHAYYNPFPQDAATLRDSSLLHHIRRYRPSTTWWCIACLLLLFLLFRLPSPSSKSTPSPKRRYEILFTHDLVEYKDSTQMADYARLDELLKQEQNALGPWPRQQKMIQFNRNDRTPNWILTNHPVVGERQPHSFGDLEMLGQRVVLPLADEHTHIAPVTAIIYYMQPQETLHSQIQAILTQSVSPHAIWIVCSPEMKNNVHSETVAFRNNKRVKVLVWEPVDWLQVALRVSTEYLWILDQDVAPGKHYLERLLRISNTEEYRDALLGIQGVVLSKNTSAASVDCAAETATRKEDTTRRVNMISDLWLLRRSWLSALSTLDSMVKESSMIGYILGRDLLRHANIPSVILPTDLSSRSEYKMERLSGNALTVLDNLCNRINKRYADALADGTAWRELIPNTLIAKKPAIAIVFDGTQQITELVRLGCRLRSKGRGILHFITTGKHRGLSAEHLRKALHRMNPGCATDVVLHDLHAGYGRSAGFAADDTIAFSSQVTRDLSQLLSVIQPKVMLYVAGDGPVQKVIKLAEQMTGTLGIALPARDLSHSLWLADLPLSSLEQWQMFSVKLVIITDRNAHSLARLIRSAARAHYFGDTVDIDIVMEQSSDRVTQAFVNSLPWPHGSKDIRHRITKVNHMPVFVESWYPASDHEYAILVDENVELSPMFYKWVKYTILRYRYSSEGGESAASAMFGISLYSPRIAENDEEGRRLFKPGEILKLNGFDEHLPYLYQSATSYGALYFPEHWREFHDYITARVADQSKKQLQNITVPHARSSRWLNSWRRYMDEFIYMRAYVMLYPNFEDYTSFCTYHMDMSSYHNHVMEDDAWQAASLFKVPLMKADTLEEQLPRDGELPAWSDLPLLDMWGNMERMDTLVSRGIELQRQVSSCAPLNMTEHMHDPSDMLCPFARLTEVQVASEEDPVPEFATRVVTVLVDSEP